ncbi:hypothetical protein GC209_17165 [bacterium]|nr:hypothetical protein [bacterium]
MTFKSKLCWLHRLNRASDEAGSATIETVLWLPAFIFILTILVETSLVFTDRSTVSRIIADTNRQLSTGQIADVNSAMAIIQSRVKGISSNAVVSTTLTNGVFQSYVSMPISDLIAPGLSPIFSGLNVVVGSEFTDENLS